MLQNILKTLFKGTRQYLGPDPVDQLAIIQMSKGRYWI